MNPINEEISHKMVLDMVHDWINGTPIETFGIYTDGQTTVAHIGLNEDKDNIRKVAALSVMIEGLITSFFMEARHLGLEDFAIRILLTSILSRATDPDKIARAKAARREEA